MKRILPIALIILGAAAAVARAQYAVTPAFPKLPVFSLPLEFARPGDKTNRIFVVQQRGIIYVIQNDPNTTVRKKFLDLSGIVSTSGNETGLLGLAFHPDYVRNGYFYVNYTSSATGQLTSYIARYRVSSDPDSADPQSGQVLLSLAQPFNNHNGGCLNFGPDGFLYASFGDGGSGGDPNKNGQNRSVLLAKILRIDVNSQDPGLQYAIPKDNPFYGNTQGFRQEIFAYGLRNVWRFSFDASGRLWAGDVGQDKYEEVDIVVKGGNYGWNTMEGIHCYSPASGCDTTGLIKPIWEYPHANSDVSVTGGYVYRGSALPSLTGKYVYADYGSGRIWAISYDGSAPATQALLIDKRTPTAMTISAFGEDESHELYLFSFGEGKIMKIVDSASAPLVTGQIPGSPFCAGGPVSVPFSVNSVNNPTFEASNVFTAQLSNAAGSFTSPVSLGTVAGTGSGVITGTLPAGTAAGAGYRIRVVASNPVTTGFTSSTLITVGAAPSATVTLGGGSALCPGDSVQLSGPPSSGATYQWLKDGVPIPGAVGTAYFATSAGGYSLVMADASGCRDTSSLVAITLNPAPQKPVITPNGLLLGTSGGVGYKWYRNGVQVGSGQTYAVTVPGSYTVQITDANGCTATSDPYNITSGVAVETGIAGRVIVYPNPVSDVIHVRFPAGGHRDAVVTMTDVSGRRVLASGISDESLARGEAMVHCPELPEGVYLLRLKIGTQVSARTVTVVRTK